VPDDLADVQPEPQPDDGTSKSAERAVRRFGKSKDHRDEPAPGGDRDGGHPQRNPGALLDLSRQ
jgi:hypothetical protein